jgi:hypothetical protein
MEMGMEMVVRRSSLRVPHSPKAAEVVLLQALHLVVRQLLAIQRRHLISNK